MARKLFCEIAPWAYRLSVEKGILQRNLQDLIRKTAFARKKGGEDLPVVVY